MNCELLNEIMNALEFYGEKRNYTDLECRSTNLTIARDDSGSRARRALELVRELNKNEQSS